VRAAGKSQYAQLVKGLEGRYVAEFEAALAAIAAKQAADSGEAEALERRLADVRAAVEAARLEKQALEAAAARSHAEGKNLSTTCCVCVRGAQTVGFADPPLCSHFCAAAEAAAEQRAQLNALRTAVRVSFLTYACEPCTFTLSLSSPLAGPESMA
jgi:hypothetical protein